MEKYIRKESLILSLQCPKIVFVRRSDCRNVRDCGSGRSEYKILLQGKTVEAEDFKGITENAVRLSVNR